MVKNTFAVPISAQHVRVYPIRFNYNICLRMELYGCSNRKLYFEFFLVVIHVILSFFIAKNCFMSAIHKGYTLCIVSNQAYSVLVKSCIHIVYMF